jgi:hypothetical protein
LEGRNENKVDILSPSLFSDDVIELEGGHWRIIGQSSLIIIICLPQKEKLSAAKDNGRKTA